MFSYLNTDFVGNFKRLLTLAFYILWLYNKCSEELYMLPDKCDSYDPNLAGLRFVYWLEWAHISHKVHKEEYIRGGYVWVYSTESKINISEFFLQLKGIRKENNIISEQKQSTSSIGK